MHSMLCMLTLLLQSTTYVSVCNFLIIKRIFNPEKVLESWESGLSINTMCVDTVDTSHKISNVFNLNTANTGEMAPFPSFQNSKWIENPSNIKEVMSQSVPAMSTLLIQVKSPHCNLNH